MALLAVEAAVLGVEAAVERGRGRGRGRCRRERHLSSKISGGCHVGDERVNTSLFTIDPLRASLVGIMGAGGVRDRGP